MANDLSQLLPQTIAQALKTLRERCVMPRLVNMDYANVPAGIGDTINVSLPVALPVSDVTPGVTPVTPPDINPQKVPVVLNRHRKTGFHLTDKQRGEIGSGIKVREIDEAMKVLANDVNSYLYLLYKGVYGFAGTPGTTPFAGADLTDAAKVRAVLNKQLAPTDDRRFVVDVNADANLVRLLGNAWFAGQNSTLQTGQLPKVLGMDSFMDQMVPTHTSTPLTAGAATVNGVQAQNAGSTDNGRTGTLSVAKLTNASPLVKGDVLTIATGPAAGTYVVTADTALAVGNTTVPISPALRGATAGGEAITLAASHVVNMAFHRDAFAFASRLLTSEGNSDQQYSIADPVSGLAIRVELIRQNKQDYIEFDILYGASLWRPELAARLAG